jgi:hypothetical protein
MHVTMTQGVVSVDISLTKEEAQRLRAILDVSQALWKVGCPVAAEVEETSAKLFKELGKAGVGYLKKDPSLK